MSGSHHNDFFALAFQLLSGTGNRYYSPFDRFSGPIGAQRFADCHPTIGTARGD